MGISIIQKPHHYEYRPNNSFNIVRKNNCACLPPCTSSGEARRREGLCWLCWELSTRRQTWRARHSATQEATRLGSTQLEEPFSHGGTTPSGRDCWPHSQRQIESPRVPAERDPPGHEKLAFGNLSSFPVSKPGQITPLKSVRFITICHT